MNKKDWKTKILDPEIQSKWRQEAQGQLREEAIEYCFKELLAVRDSPIGSEVLPMVRIDDDIISSDLKAELIKNVQVLEEQPKDWHPGSDGKVLDLVHPSLYCAVVGKTHYQENGEMVVMKKKGGFVSNDNYQWIPAEFNVDTHGQVKIESYINNLHPEKFKQLYSVLERVFEKSIPYLEDVVSHVASQEHLRITYKYDDYYPDHPEPDYEPDGTDDYDERFDALYEEWQNTKVPSQPKIPTEYVPPVINRPISLKDRKLQVIVKMSNIHLTPEKPKYDGGVWHIEGTNNEQIISTVIYYYDSENITSSKLSFRAAIETPYYDQGDEVGPREIYGLEDEVSLLNQNLGSVECIQDRIVVFPNLYQHKVEPFELLDATKPGHRKILVFFVVNPTTRVLSSKDIPFQQKEWGTLELNDTFRAKLPFEINEKIASENTYWMDFQQAKEYREKLMEARRAIVDETTEMYFEESFSLCEH